MKPEIRNRTIASRIVPFFLFVLFAVSCAAAQGEEESVPEPEASEVVVWQGEPIVFTKADGADPALAENQDRITESVWLTRGNDGGQIFNIAERDRSVKSSSPDGTLWALGTTADLPNLEFRPFRIAVQSPKNVVGKDLVLFLEAEQIYLDVKFLSWSQGKLGGFSYERSRTGPVIIPG